MTPGPGIEPGTHWWKASALTTAPTLLPHAQCTVFLSSYRNTSGRLGEREMLWEHELQAGVSTAFSSSPNFHESFYIWIETWRTCFLFLLAKHHDKEKESSLL